MNAPKIDTILSSFSRVSLSELPTPMSRLSRLSRHYSRKLYCKRDDLTGFAFGGNKARKLEYLIANAQQARVDTIVAVGAIQSNFCRMTAAAAARSGLDCQLVLGGRTPDVASGNLILDKILGANITLCDSDDWEDWDQVAEELTAELRAEGRKVYRMTMGGSTPVGALGYVAAFAEILRDAQRLDVQFGQIILASSTGGTQAGLLVGKALTGWPGRIVGISVAHNKVDLANVVFEIATATAKLLHTSISPRDVIVDDDFVGQGYGIASNECLAAIETFARLEGIFLDRVYSGKAAAAMLSYLEQRRITSKEAAVFLHTGGNVELFARHPTPT